MKNFVGEVWTRWEHGERIYDLDEVISHNTAMTLTLDPETWFKVTAHPLHQGALWVRAKLGQGDKNVPDKWSRADRRTEKGQTDIIGGPQSSTLKLHTGITEWQCLKSFIKTMNEYWSTLAVVLILTSSDQIKIYTNYLRSIIERMNSSLDVSDNLQQVLPIWHS